jgi:predicted  nucleic acid-binding Zn-ribbon protein
MMTLKDITLAMEAKGLFNEVEQLREIRESLEVEINNAHEKICKQNLLIKQLQDINERQKNTINYMSDDISSRSREIKYLRDRI